MAKQTINIGASPNDGTGTPLRTAFDYTNQNFTELYTATGPSGNNIVVPGSATITGDLTVDTSTLKVDSANNRVGIGTASPSNSLDVIGTGAQTVRVGSSNGDLAILSMFSNGNATWSLASDSVYRVRKDSTEHHRIDATGIATWSNVGGVAGTAMTLNATGLGVGGSPVNFPNYTTIHAIGKTTTAGGVFQTSTSNNSTAARFACSSTGVDLFVETNHPLSFYTNAVKQMTLDTSGSVGIGVTPSAWVLGKVLEVGQLGNALWSPGSGDFRVMNNAFYGSGPAFKYAANGFATMYQTQNGQHQFHTAPSGTAGNAITFTQAMTLDASGNLLVGVTSGTSNVIKKTLTPDAGNVVLDVYGNNTSATFYSVSAFGANAANAAVKTGKDNVTSRSINSGGTINASGADYAEYLTKGSDFVLAKGDIAGIDTNGKLTNVFADAVSFVVKSTDPSYVGNDKWGVDLEGDALEAARQLVDRIAFAGQVPVNVTGAKAGDYIVPVVDGTGIKGIAVSNPTFEQYQLAVGKVIAIDADGRARIIVKVA